MRQEDKDLEIVGNFFSAFYYDNTDDVDASSYCLSYFLENLDYRKEVISSFDSLLKKSIFNGTLAELVRVRANRYVRDDKEAIEFIKRVWKLNLFDIEM